VVLTSDIPPTAQKDARSIEDLWSREVIEGVSSATDIHTLCLSSKKGSVCMPERAKHLFLSAILLVGADSLMASKRILVDLTHQIAIAYQDGQVKFYGRISSGRPGMETPTGSFYVREKELDHVSNLWPKPNGGARMPYMLRITRDGVALHLDPAPDYPASHGCIRMRDGFAQKIYAWAPKWTRVDVIGKAPAHSPAVRLPDYAMDPKILKRSIGGGTGGPMAALSTNPKDHVKHRRLLFDPDITSDTTNPKIYQVRTKHNAHPDPLEILSNR
jgi:hypothetical protein